jgi:hypothetical protein
MMMSVTSKEMSQMDPDQVPDEFIFVGVVNKKYFATEFVASVRSFEDVPASIVVRRRRFFLTGKLDIRGRNIYSEKFH